MSRAMLAHWRACAPALGFSSATITLTVPDDSLETLRMRWSKMQSTFQQDDVPVFGVMTTLRSINNEQYNMPARHDLCRMATLYYRQSRQAYVDAIITQFFDITPHKGELPFTKTVVFGLGHWDALIKRIGS